MRNSLQNYSLSGNEPAVLGVTSKYA